MLRFNYEEYEYEIYPQKVTYKKRGKVIEQYALPNKGWWVETCNKHDHLEFIKFTPIEITQDMQKRFESIKNFDRYDLAVKYIEGEELPTFITDFLLGKVDTIDQKKLDEYYVSKEEG